MLRSSIIHRLRGAAICGNAPRKESLCPEMRCVFRGYRFGGVHRPRHLDLG